MNPGIRYHFQLGVDYVLNSYSQLFFSDNRWFALLLLLSSFVDPYCGFSGLVALLITYSACLWLKLPEAGIRRGVYGYNSLLIGLVIALYFEYGPEYWLILALGSFLTLLLSAWMATSLNRIQLPLLGIPFLLGIWIVLLSVRRFDAIDLNERGIFLLNELYALGGMQLVEAWQFIQNPPIPRFWEVYLKSLGAIFFQYNIVSGFFIALGILIYSRIAFSLSLLGFATGYYFYLFIGGGLSELFYSFIGFNFILASISLGGFFVIPSWRSYLLIFIMTPIMALVVSALSYLFTDLQLPLYSLPFNLLILLLILVLRLNTTGRGLQLVSIQDFQPEKNLYRFLNYQERFGRHTAVVLHPPFWGEWSISQDEKGTITHLGEWRYAWDFVVKDDKNATFKQPGTVVSDYYAYGLPVLAPAAGTVVEVADGVEDNPVGGVELKQNWGNTVVLWHGHYLYTKISHLKAGSIPVKPGDYIAKGDTLGLCGNSGRSPEPHIHFQVQTTPYIGSRTLRYPMGYYLERVGNILTFRQFDYPKEGAPIQAIHPVSLMSRAYDWPVGKVWLWDYQSGSGTKQVVRWEVMADWQGNRYLWCSRTRSAAWFNRDDTCFWFYHFSGDRDSALFHFFCANAKVLLSWQPDVTLTESLPVNLVWKNYTRYLQDFAAPLGIFMKGTTAFRFISCDDPHHPGKMECQTTLTRSIANRPVSSRQYNISIYNKGIYKFTLGNREWVCIES